MSTQPKFENPEEFRAWNEEMSRLYDPEAFHLHSSYAIRLIEQRRVQTLLRLLAPRPDDHVLEIGVGAGNILEQVKSKHLLGVDISQFLMRKAQQRLSARNAKLSFASAEALPFPDSTFQRVYSTEVIEHVQHPDVLVQEMARVATPDAVLVITIPNDALIDQIKAIIAKIRLERWVLKGSGPTAYQSPRYNNWHLHRIDLKRLKALTADHLVIQQVRAIPFPMLPVRYVVSFKPLT